MNILPKKRWHVRTKDNIARVRRDEALAREEEKKKELRNKKAEREAKAEALRQKARQQYGHHTPMEIPKPSPDTSSSNQHINLFYELENQDVVSDKKNKEREEEKKQEREKYEKQIGYLTYLGQDTNELTGNVAWYNKSKEIPTETEEVAKKQKGFEDPLAGIRKYLGCESIKKIRKEVIKEKKEARERKKRRRSESDDRKKHKKSKKSKKSKKKKRKHEKRRSSGDSSESEVDIIKKEPCVDVERLRAERLKREREERKRAEEVLARINGVVTTEKEPEPEPTQRYNSQFNPHLAKQNFPK